MPSRTVDFALDPLPTTVVTGTVTDGSGHGWPLYARIDIDGFPGGPVFTDPVTGEYSIELLESTAYTFTVTAVSAGYVHREPPGRRCHPMPRPRTSRCPSMPPPVPPPDYEFVGFTGATETFDSGTLPAGWEVIDNIGNGQVWRFDDPGGRGNLTGGDGLFAVIDSDSLRIHRSAGHRAGHAGRRPVSGVRPGDHASTPTTTTWPTRSTSTSASTAAPPGPTCGVGPPIPARPRVEVINIPDAAGEQDVQVRFHYYDGTSPGGGRSTTSSSARPSASRPPAGSSGNVHRSDRPARRSTTPPSRSTSPPRTPRSARRRPTTPTRTTGTTSCSPR